MHTYFLGLSYDVDPGDPCPSYGVEIFVLLGARQHVRRRGSSFSCGGAGRKPRASVDRTLLLLFVALVHVRKPGSLSAALQAGPR